MKRILWLLLILSFTVLVLTACAGGESAETTPTSTPGAPSASVSLLGPIKGPLRSTGITWRAPSLASSVLYESGASPRSSTGMRTSS